MKRSCVVVCPIGRYINIAYCCYYIIQSESELPDEDEDNFESLGLLSSPSKFSASYLAHLNNKLGDFVFGLLLPLDDRLLIVFCYGDLVLDIIHTTSTAEGRGHVRPRIFVVLFQANGVRRLFPQRWQEKSWLMLEVLWRYGNKRHHFAVYRDGFSRG